MKTTIERDKVASTIQLVRSAPFSPTSRKLVEKALPSQANREIEEIYRDSSEERKRRKKKRRIIIEFKDYLIIIIL